MTDPTNMTLHIVRTLLLSSWNISVNFDPGTLNFFICALLYVTNILLLIGIFWAKLLWGKWWNLSCCRTCIGIWMTNVTNVFLFFRSPTFRYSFPRRKHYNSPWFYTLLDLPLAELCENWKRWRDIICWKRPLKSRYLAMGCHRIHNLKGGEGGQTWVVCVKTSFLYELSPARWESIAKFSITLQFLPDKYLSHLSKFSPLLSTVQFIFFSLYHI